METFNHMRYFKTLISLFLIGLLMGCVGFEKVRSPSSLVSHMSKSTVALVFADDDAGWRPFCTAVWLDDGMIATAHHCVQAVANKLAGVDAVDADVMGVKVHYIQANEVEGIGEEPSGVHLAKVVADDAEHDVSLMRAVGGAVPGHEYARLASYYPAIGEKIHLVGHVKGLYWSYIEGVVSSYRGDIPAVKDDIKISGPFIQLSAPVYYGNSGGGVFNNDGDLVGIVSFMLGAPVTNFAVPVRRVRALVKEAHEAELKIKK